MIDYAPSTPGRRSQIGRRAAYACITVVAISTVLGAGPWLAPAANANQVPFSATMNGTVHATTGPGCAFPTICLAGTDEGTGTHVGRATLTKTATIHVTRQTCTNGGTLTTYTESGTLAGANGDTLTLTGGGTACLRGGHAIASGQLNVAGGTGRFNNATGRLDETIDHNLSNDTEVVNLRGTISSPGSTK